MLSARHQHVPVFLGVSAAFSHYIPRSLFFFSRLFFSHFAARAVHCASAVAQEEEEEEDARRSVALI